MRNLTLGGLLFLATSIGLAAQTSLNCAPMQNQILNYPKPGQQAQELFKLYWKTQMFNYPTWAQSQNYPGVDYSDWTDMSVEAIEKRRKQERCFYSIATKISSDKLSFEDRISLETLLFILRGSMDGESFPSEYLVLNQMSGGHQDIADSVIIAPVKNLQDYNILLKKMSKAPRMLKQNQILLEIGLKKGVTPPRVVLEDLPRQFSVLLQEPIEKNPIFAPFQEISLNVSQAEKEDIKAQAKKIIIEKIFPSLKAFRGFVLNQYIPGCRKSLAQSDLPNGKAWYKYSVYSHTTLEKTPEEIHELGLAEVRRLRLEMEKVKESTGFNGTLEKFNQYLRQDKKFYFDNPKDLIVAYRDIAKRVDPILPRLFGKLPRLTYGVRAMPEYKAQSAPTAYYYGGSAKQGVAGYFEANTSQLETRSIWQMEALTLHEAVPGHHLQISLAQEMENLPEFRRESGFTAYTEGWGLYAESLGEDLGLYKDPYSKYGQLNYEMWRAVRLVIDTGLHFFSWSREQAIDFFVKNSAFPQKQIETEVDRYIAWPGQALAYKVGQLKISELRQRAQKSLGARYSIRDYHDFVLSLGSVPLSVLEREFDRWLENTNKTGKLKGKAAGKAAEMEKAAEKEKDKAQ